MNELAGDSDDEEEEGLTVAAPPSYNDVFTEPGRWVESSQMGGVTVESQVI